MSASDETLPNGWAMARLEELLVPLKDGRALHHGWSPQCEKEPAGTENEWGVLKTTAIQPGAFHPEHNKKLPKNLSPRPQHEVEVGDLLITCAGPRVRCGIPCLVRNTRPKLMLSGKMYRFRVSDEHFDARYLEKYLLSHTAQDAIDSMKTGGNESGLNLTHDRFKPLPVPVAPLNEQKRIASKIDELFSEIEEGERALERGQKLVERYRQSVLKAAVTGELTRDWRKKNKTKLESGEALLARILKARRDAWEKTELAKMKAKGITPSNNKWKEKYQEPSAPDTADLPDLPQEWVWSSIGQLFHVSVGSTPSRKEPTYWSGDIPWVSSGEVAFCRIRDTKEKISQPGFENSSVRLHPKGTVLLAMIGEGKTRGQAAILDIEACHNQNAASIGVPATPIPPEYVYLFLRFRYEKTRAIGQGGNQPALNSDLVKGIKIPLPPLLEIEKICDLVEHQFSVIQVIETEMLKQRRLLCSQKQSILREAFRGNLVRGDPSDEPASVLLARIAAERESSPAKASRGRKPATTKTKKQAKR